MSEQACPISFEPRIDSTVLRINSLFYLLALWSSFFFEEPYILIPLIIIFISKNFNPKFDCLLDLFSKKMVSALHLKSNMIDPSPKKLANAMGLAMSSVVFTLALLESDLNIFPFTMLSIAFILEASLDYCIGCKIYGLWIKISRWKIVL